MLVGWYLRRAIPWMALLGLLRRGPAAGRSRWPSGRRSALVLLPGLLASCAAAAAFCFDEAALPVVEVTPRGAGWRRTARLAVVLVPLGGWTVVVVVRPGDLPLDRSGWWLVGVAAIALTSGLAARASRRAVASPGRRWPRRSRWSLSPSW